MPAATTRFSDDCHFPSLASSELLSPSLASKGDSDWEWCSSGYSSSYPSTTSGGPPPPPPTQTSRYYTRDYSAQYHCGCLTYSSNDVVMRGFHSDTSVREPTNTLLEEKVAVHLKFMQSGTYKLYMYTYCTQYTYKCIL